ncbi:MAG: universal stress protein [Bdellovibrionales bacterium]|nr:universal stress protein [Bdellovibrionales bacterium]
MDQKKYIVACINGFPPSESVIQYGAWISKHSDKELMLYHCLDPQRKEADIDMSGSIGLGAKEDLLKEIVELEFEQNKILLKKAKLILESAKQQVLNAGANEPKTTVEHGRLIENLLSFKDEISLAIIGRYGQHHQEANKKGVVGHNVEGVIRSLEQPVLVVSKEFSPPKKALIAFDGSKASLKALNFICERPIFKNIEIDVVYVGEDNENSQSLVSMAKTMLTDNNVKNKTVILKGEPEKAILNYADKNQIDFIAMGAFSHNWIHDFIIGSFTSKMLTLNDKPLLLIR